MPVYPEPTFDGEPGSGPRPQDTAASAGSPVAAPPFDIAATRVVGRRYLQYLVDRLLIVGAGLVVAVVVFGLVLLGLWAGWPATFMLYVALVLYILAVLAIALWIDVWIPHTRGGATPAMRWFGLRIVSLHGEPPSLRDYLVRWLLSVVDGLFLGLAGAVLIAMTPLHQRMGDIVACTVVVRVT
jgi:uncharacterized RDD family membrane protein YckC